MRTLFKVLKSLDNIAPQVNLTYMNESRMKTAFGGTVVLLIYIIISLGLFYFSRDILFKINPITKTNKTFLDSVEYPASTFPLFFFFSDRLINILKPGHPLLESIEIVPELWIVTSDENGNTSTKYSVFGLMECNEEYFKGYERFYRTTVNPNSFCIDYSKIYDPAGNETDDESVFREFADSGATNFINMKIKMCDEKKKPGCRKAFEDAGQIIMYMGYPSAVVDFDDYDNPITNSLAFFQNSFSPGLFARKYASLSVNEFIGDTGWVLTDTTSQRYIQTSIYDTDVIEYAEPSRSVFAFSFRLDLIKEIMERRYPKVQEILANVGGFLKAVVLAATLLVKHFSEFSFFTNFGRELTSLSSKKHRLSSDVMVNKLVSTSKNESKVGVLKPGRLPTVTVDTKITFFKFLLEAVFCRSTFVSKEKEKVFRHLDISFISSKLLDVMERSDLFKT